MPAACVDAVDRPQRTGPVTRAIAAGDGGRSNGHLYLAGTDCDHAAPGLDTRCTMLIFIRHGRTRGNAHGLLQGRVDNPLDEVGLRQAAAIAVALRGARHPRVISSSLARARQTADALRLAVDIDDRFIELDYGDLDGVPIREVPAETWARWRVDPQFAPGGGESLAALQARVEQACRELAGEAAERDVLVVSHVSPIKAAVAWALGVGPATTWRMSVAQATITRIDTSRGHPVLSSFNEEAHLRESDLA